MGEYNLDRIFKPRHVAVVGASEETGTIGNALMKNLIEGGFSGTLLPVNPKYKAVHGHSSFGSVSDLEMGVDLAVIATPIHSVPDSVREWVGNLGFCSQSGAICTAIRDLAFKEHIGFSHFVSTGSMVDVDFGDIIDYLGNDPSAKS